MAQHWWVNHNQTVRQEIDGEYLWSPKVERNGARSEFYNNMRRASPGDLVLSYSDQAVRYVGQVTEFAFSSPKPAEFGTKGSYWNTEGWLLPVVWVPLTPPVPPKPMIGKLGPLLPIRHSPIHPVAGVGNQKAYLAAVSPLVFEVILSCSAFDLRALASRQTNHLIFRSVQERLDTIVEHRISQDRELDSTVRESVILARRGQGTFRTNVEHVEHGCRLTGVTTPSLLIASHIKPWRLCGSAHERLDGMNGLLLTPDADLLFDRGYISFQDNGEVLVSPRISTEDLSRLGFDNLAGGVRSPLPQSRLQPFARSQRKYLDYHRDSLFLG